MKYRIFQFLNLIWKIFNKPGNFLLYLELYRISWLERYKKSHIKIFGRDILIADSASFLSAYREIFDNEIYKFKTDVKNPLILDCGANIGLSIIYFKKLYPESKIIAFEPDFKIYEILKYNLSSFQFLDVEIINKGLSNKAGEADFYSEGADAGRIVLKEDAADTIKIETIRLIDYLKEPIDFLKIDIEGIEYDVLFDSKDYLKNVRNLFVEYHSFFGKEQNFDKILEIIKAVGFRHYISQSGTFIRVPFMQIQNNLLLDLQLNIFAYRI